VRVSSPTTAIADNMTLRGLRCGSLSQITQGSRNRGCLRCGFHTRTPSSPLLTYSESLPNVRESNRALTTTAFMPRLQSEQSFAVGTSSPTARACPMRIYSASLLWASVGSCQGARPAELHVRLRHATSRCSPFIIKPGTEKDGVISNPGMDRVSNFTPTVGRIMWLYQISFPLRWITHDARQT
jgi:hypothetical protein